VYYTKSIQRTYFLPSKEIIRVADPVCCAISVSDTIHKTYREHIEIF